MKSLSKTILGVLTISLILSSCSENNTQLMGKWTDELGLEYEIVNINGNLAVTTNGKTFPIDMSENTMSVTIDGEKVSMLFDRDKDVLFWNGVTTVRTNRRQLPKFEIDYGNNDFIDKKGIFASFDGKGTNYSKFRGLPIVKNNPGRPNYFVAIIDNVLGIAIQLVCVYVNGQLECEVNRVIKIEDNTAGTVHFKLATFKYDHASDKMICSVEKDGNFREHYVFPYHRNDNCSLEEMLYVDEFEGNWIAYYYSGDPWKYNLEDIDRSISFQCSVKKTKGSFGCNQSLPLTYELTFEEDEMSGFNSEFTRNGKNSGGLYATYNGREWEGQTYYLRKWSNKEKKNRLIYTNPAELFILESD